MKRCCIVLLALFFLIPSSFAQQSEDKPLNISPEEREAAVRAIVKEFDARYVFPEVASKVKQTIEERLVNKGYDQITTGQALAATLTTDLQAITKDKHVRVNCKHPEATQTR